MGSTLRCANLMLLEHDEMAVDQQATVECRQRQLELQWFDEHRHAPWRTAARDGKEHALRPEFADGRDGSLGQSLLRCHERSVDVGEQEPDGWGLDVTHTTRHREPAHTRHKTGLADRRRANNPIDRSNRGVPCSGIGSCSMAQP